MRRIKLWSETCSYQSLYDEYKNGCLSNATEFMSINSFGTLWNECRPNIVHLTQRSEMCTSCGRFRNLISSHMRLSASESVD